jgi:hypothetical protein
MTPSPSDGTLTTLTPPSQDLSITVRSSYQQNPSEGFPPGLAAQVLYAGPAPLEVEGLGQINVLIPSIGSDVLLFNVAVISADGAQAYISPGAVVWTR